MIIGFRDDRLEAFFVDNRSSRRIPADIEARLFRKIQMIDDASSDRDLRVPPSNHFERLKDGARGEARDLYLDDHSYR